MFYKKIFILRLQELISISNRAIWLIDRSYMASCIVGTQSLSQEKGRKIKQLSLCILIHNT